MHLRMLAIVIAVILAVALPQAAHAG